MHAYIHEPYLYSGVNYEPSIELNDDRLSLPAMQRGIKSNFITWCSSLGTFSCIDALACVELYYWRALALLPVDFLYNGGDDTHGVVIKSNHDVVGKLPVVELKFPTA